MLNVAKVEVLEVDLHHQLIYHDKEKMKDHGAYQDRMKMPENIKDMDR